jgi:hypothetical protein
VVKERDGCKRQAIERRDERAWKGTARTRQGRTNGEDVLWGGVVVGVYFRAAVFLTAAPVRSSTHPNLYPTTIPNLNREHSVMYSAVNCKRAVASRNRKGRIRRTDSLVVGQIGQRKTHWKHNNGHKNGLPRRSHMVALYYEGHLPTKKCLSLSVRKPPKLLERYIRRHESCCFGGRHCLRVGRGTVSRTRKVRGKISPWTMYSPRKARCFHSSASCEEPSMSAA